MFVRLTLEIMAGALEPRALARAVRYSRDIARLSREIGKTELANMRAQALARLASDPKWKAQVRLQLGGYWVIKEWADRFRFQTARAARVTNAKTSGASITPHVPANPALPHIKPRGAITAAPQPSRPDIKTDATGQFRLAPIPRTTSPRLQKDNAQAAQSLRPRANRDFSRAGRLVPTPLTPDAIRIPKIKPYPDLSEDWEWDRRTRRYVNRAADTPPQQRPP